MVKADARSSFISISERLCMCTLELSKPKRKIVMICAYAPTLPCSEANPEIRDDFYNQLESVIKRVRHRDFLIVAGDFNAQTGSGYRQYAPHMGRFGKGRLNSNGIELLDLASRNNLFLTNTVFSHKLAHISTWESPDRNIKGRDGQPRRNPIRNQIDYILIRCNHSQVVTNSRSYSGLTTYTDHRLVRMSMKLSHRPYKGNYEKKINFSKLKDPILRAKYTFATEVHHQTLEDTNTNQTVQGQWDNIIEANKQAAKDVLGYNTGKRSTNPEIIELTNRQKELGTLANTTTNTAQRKSLKSKRNTIMNQIHFKLGEIENQRIIDQVKEIEAAKSDPERMFRAVKAVYSVSDKKPLYIDTPDGTTTNPDKQAEIITSFFKDMFSKKDMSTISNIPPREMSTPFSKEEIERAIKSLKNNKAVGVDGLRAEQLKANPDTIASTIADIMNHVAKTGEAPKEIKLGELVPLQKPGKKRGPTAHLRPIILLSLLRKILAICLIRRIGGKIDEHIPNTQAAYRPGRSTTEHVFAVKLLAEKAITSSNYDTHILLMDMSKAFDTIHRNKVVEDLRSILQPDELHLVKILIEDVKLTVNVGKSKGKTFTTNIGTPQGDCLSPTLFTLYLSNALSPPEERTPSPILYDHTYCKMKTLPHGNPNLHSTTTTLDHPYCKPPTDGLTMDFQYPDDIGWIGRNYQMINDIKQRIPTVLAERHLTINESKTEQYVIDHQQREGPWRKCKYLGSMLGTKEDISNRKRNANTAFHRLKPILQNKRLHIDIKVRIFDALVGSIFLYNSELWSLTETMQEEIDSFHRKMLRWVMNIRYPNTMSSVEVYDKTKATKWSEEITKRRIRWFGHMARLPPTTPARRAMDESINTQTTRPRGRPKTTWMSTVAKDLATVNLTVEQALNAATNRKTWRGIVYKMV